MTSRSRSASTDRSCRLEESSTYLAERGRKSCKLPSLGRDVNTCQVEISFEDRDTGNIITENLEVRREQELVTSYF